MFETVHDTTKRMKGKAMKRLPGWALAAGLALLCAAAGNGGAAEGRKTEFARPPLPLALMPGATDGRGVFMGFDFDAPVDWDGDPEAECGGFFRCFRLESPWHGFESAVATGNVVTGNAESLEFSRAFEPWGHGIDRESARRLAEDLAREIGEECGIPLSPAETADSLDVAYGGQTGAFTVLLGFAWYPYEPSGKLTEASRALGCRFHVWQVASRPPPHVEDGGGSLPEGWAFRLGNGRD